MPSSEFAHVEKMMVCIENNVKQLVKLDTCGFMKIRKEDDLKNHKKNRERPALTTRAGHLKFFAFKGFHKPASPQLC